MLEHSYISHSYIGNRFCVKWRLDIVLLLLKRSKNIEDKDRNKRYNFGQEMSVLHRSEDDDDMCDSYDFEHPVRIRKFRAG